MKTPKPLVALLGLTLAACAGKEGSEKAVRTPPVLTGVPVPALATVIDSTGTADAGQVVFLVGMPPESVTAFYRRELPRAGFRIVGDVGDSLRADLYAQRQGPSLWVQIRPAREPNITMFTLIGAVTEAAGKGDSVPGRAKR
jgi:hypothetical protein